MGGAFIAVADDATAASWNPAGLTQLKKPEISFAYSFFKRRDDFSSRSHPEASGVQESWTDELNYLSVAYPFELLNRNMIVSLNYQLLYEFEREIDIRIDNKAVLPLTTTKMEEIDFSQSGNLRALAPAFAIEVTPDFSLGFTFNIWTDKLFWSNGWTSKTTSNAKIYKGGMLNGGGTLLEMEKFTRYDRYHDFSGFNMNIGFLWVINRYFTLGGVIKTPFTADIKHKQVTTTNTRAPGSALIKQTVRIDEDVDLDMPFSYGLGLAVRFSDRFTTSLDIYRTEWDKFKLEDGKGNRINAVTGKLTSLSSSEDTVQVRLGGEYLFIFPRTVVPVRGGVFYDPEPSENNPEDFWGFALGSGVSIGDLIFDCAYQFRTGRGVEGDTLTNLKATDADVEQHLFMVSCIFHF
jgi:long-subunit fatty acid transport protein